MIDTPRVWYDSSGRSHAKTLINQGWLPLNMIISPWGAVQIGISGLGPPSKDRCRRLTSSLVKSEADREFLPIWEAISSVNNEGVRIIKSKRPVISSSCLKLFDLPMTLIDVDRAGEEEQSRWSLVIKTQAQGVGKEPVMVTLPLPISPSTLPVDWREGGALAQLWSKRQLWWGAEGCWRYVKHADLSVPLPSKLTRWVNLSKNYPPRVITAFEWLIPSASFNQMTTYQAGEREQAVGLSIETQGVVGSHFGRDDTLPLRTFTPSLSGIWDDHQKTFVAYAMVSVTSLVPYETLAQISGEQKVHRMAFAQGTSLGAFLFVPRKPYHAPVDWRTDEVALLKLSEEHASTLEEGDVVTTGLHAVDAYSLLGEPSLFEGGKRGLLKERLARGLRMTNETIEMEEPKPGQAEVIYGGPWLGQQSHRVVAPISQLP